MKLLQWDQEIVDQILDSCDLSGSSSFHEGCHPALYLVEVDGRPVVRCFDCLEGEALEEETQLLEKFGLFK